MANEKVYKRKLSDLVPDAKNANKGTERGLRLLDDSLSEDGAGRGVLLDRNNKIMAGNKTIERAVDQGFTEIIIVPTDGHQLVATQRVDVDIDSPQGRRMALRDNRVGQVDLEWDTDVLKALQEQGDVDLSKFWTDDELALLLDLQEEPTPDPGAQLDKADALQQKWQVARGDLWQVGKHRLLCGDSTRAELTLTDVLITDPPYGIEIDTSWLTSLHIQRGKPANASDDRLQGDDGSLDLSFMWKYERRMVWGFPYIFDPCATGWIVWDKQPGIAERGIVTPVEMASTTMRKGFDMIRVMWGGYYRAAGETREPHPTQKPVQVIAPFIEQWTNPTDVIYDPFGGSGTTMVACEQLGRQCRMIEIEPKYCAVTLERLSLMGLTPERVPA